MLFWILLLVAVVAVPRVLARRRRRRAGTGKPYKYRPMKLLVGSAGTGKSYYLTFQAVKSLAEGRGVLVNFGMRPDRVYLALRKRYGLDHRPAMAALGRIHDLATFDDWINAKNLDCYIDEVQNFIPGQDWALIPWPVITKFAEHRHFKLRVTMACHRFLSLHTYVREGLVAEVFVARSPGVLNRMGRGMRTLVMGPQLPTLHYMQVKDESDELAKDVKKKKRALSRWQSSEAVPLDPLVASCYNYLGGVFESPMASIQRQKNKHAGMTLVTRDPEPLPESSPADDLPALTIAEVAQLGGNGGTDRARTLLGRPGWPELRSDAERGRCVAA